MKRDLLFIVALWVLISPLAGAEIGPETASARTARYTSKNLRDPFQSIFEIERERYKLELEPEAKAILPVLEVQGMVWGAKMPQAIINNTVLRVGESIEGAEILDIRKEGVYVLYEGQGFMLKTTISKSGE